MKKSIKLYIMLCGVGGALCFILYGLLPSHRQDQLYYMMTSPITIMRTVNLPEEIHVRREEMQRFYNDGIQHGELAYIAHGGGIGQYTYTNCVEAFEDSIQKGFRYIEVDLLETADGHLIGAHDWEDLAKLTGQEAKVLKKLPLCELEKLSIKGRFQILSGRKIFLLMQDNPHVVLVTDKIQNFELLVREIPLPDRMIVETDWKETPEARLNYLKAICAGIKYPAYSAVYNLDYAEQYQFPLIIVSASLMLKSPETIEKLKTMHQNKITVLVCNSKDKVDFIKEHLGRNISMIYTDTWYPRGSSPLSSDVEQSVKSVEKQ